MRILWMSNAGHLASGYGNQTGLFAPLLKAKGHDVAVAAFAGIESSIVNDERGITNYPRFGHPYMNDIIAEHYDHHKAEAIITLIDPWVLDTKVYSELKWCAWAPLDSAPILPASVYTLQYARWIWAMSRFGERQLHAAGLGAKTVYVPHGVDTKRYKPIDRDEAREKIGKTWKRDLKGKFIVMMNSANKGAPSRKGFYEAFAGFARYAKINPNALLYVHTEEMGIYGEDLRAIMRLVGLDSSQVVFPANYQYLMGLYPEDYLNYAYNAADVFLHTSHGEGFGIPLVEAQSAGLPVIVTNFSAMPELCFSGWQIEAGTMFMYAPGALQRLPDIGEIALALEAAEANEFSRDEAREGALAYDYKVVYEQYMKPAIEKMKQDIDGAALRAQEHRAFLQSLRAKAGDNEI